MRRGGWKTHGWTLALLATLVVTVGAGLLSGAFTWGHYVDDRHLIAFGEGELVAWLLTDPCADDLGLEDIFADYYSPGTWSAEGLTRNPPSHLRWRWPSLHMESHRGVGTWWEIGLPVWTVVMGLAAVGVARWVRVVDRRRKGASMCLRWSRAARITLALSLGTTALVVGVWLTSISYWLAYGGTRCIAELDRCALVLRTVSDLDGADADLADVGWASGVRQPARWSWELPHSESLALGAAGAWSAVVLPLWMLLLVAAAPAAFIMWRHRPRREPGFCRKCGYDLTGNVSGRCPECGHLVHPIP